MQGTRRKSRISNRDMIIAIIIAFSAWFYVVYNIDPNITKNYKDIPITFGNIQSLNDNELAIKSADFDSIDITLTGKRSLLNSTREEDIVVSVDMTDAGKGENLLALNVKVPAGTMVRNKSADSITITVERLSSKEVETLAMYEDQIADTYEPTVTEKTPDTVEVYGAESLVNQVTYAKIPLDAKKIGKKAKTFSVKPIPVDKNGNAVKYITVSPNKMSVSVINSAVKEVALNAVVENAVGENGEIKYSYPQTVVIKGSPDDLSGIDKVNTVSIDFADVTESGFVELEYDLPEAVTVANASLGQVMKTTYIPYIEKKIEIGAGEIKIKGLADGLSAIIEQGVIVTVKGKESELSKLSGKDFEVTADAGEIESEGAYTVSLSVFSKYNNVVLSDEMVLITVNSDDR